MDGNGRWAKKNKLRKSEGHRRGSEAVDNLLDICLKYKISVISLYAFSTENWKRPKTEITNLFKLLDEFILSKLSKLLKNNIQLMVSGNISKLPKKSRLLLEDAVKQTTDNILNNNKKSITVNFCINYGSQNEIIYATKNMIEDNLQKYQSKEINIALIKKIISKINSKQLEKYLYTAGLPNVDLLIRTSGEKRLSNFMLWQSAYAELYFVDKLWPDFSEEDLVDGFIEFQNRTRKFGA